MQIATRHAAIIIGLLLAGYAHAEPDTLSGSMHPRPTPPPGSITPKTSVDPGMKIVRPTPPARTPVIKPKSTTTDGKVIIPK